MIEEYDALGVAIASALQKFAPEHETRIVRSLEEAESVARQIRPELVVLDFDPSYPRAVEFFTRMKAAHPDTRVLVIGAGTSAEISLEQRRAGAFQFIEKPFELAEFGAAVQALLGPWTGTSPGDSRGTLRDLGLSDLVPLACVGGSSGVLRVESAAARTGEVHVVAGHISHATTGALAGAEALLEMLRWRHTNFTEAAIPTDAPRSIHGPWGPVFAELLRKARAAERTDGSSAPAQPEVAPAHPGKKILVIDDTEMLLVFVEDILASAAPGLQIVTAATGAEGLRRAEAMMPDLILTDFSLPDLNGDEICERLLANAITSEIPVLMMSGHVTEMNAAAERLTNIVAVIPKPFFSAELLKLVQRTLDDPSRPQQKQESVMETPAAAPRAVPSAPLGDVPFKAPIPHTRGKSRVKAGRRAAVDVGATLSDIESTSQSEVKSETRPQNPPVGIETNAKTDSAPPSETALAPFAPIRVALPHRQEGEVVQPAMVLSPPAEVLLVLPLEVISMQFTSTLQMGAIRARPSSRIVALHLHSAALREGLHPGLGFELGLVTLDASGQLETLRLAPARQMVEAVASSAALQLGVVGVVPDDPRSRVQFTPAAASPMELQLRVQLELMGVELSSTFEVAELTLKARGAEGARVTLDFGAGENAGVVLHSATILLDRSARIAETLLDLGR